MSVEACLITAIGALVTVVGILWGIVWMYLTFLRKGYKDLVTRVRSLEDARLEDEIRHGHDLKCMANQLTECRREDRKVIVELINAIKSMPCKADFNPQNQRNIETDTLYPTPRAHHQPMSGGEPCVA